MTRDSETRERAPSPRSTLTRHFFVSFFRLSFLDDAGEESFRKALIGLFTIVGGAGLLLTRLYMTKYGGLAASPSFAAIVSADRLFVITVPMVVTTLAMAMIAHAIFPDEIDFRTLMALPLTRRTIFAAKTLALIGFVAIFVGGSILGVTLPLSLIISRDAQVPYLAAIAAQLFVGTWAALFAVAVAIAVQGVIAMMLPRTWLRQASMAAQTMTVALLVLAMPFVLRMPGWLEPIASHRAWLFAVPPAWFLGAAQWLLGHHDPFWRALMFVGFGATGLACATAASCSLAVFARFDQSVLRPSGGRRRREWLRWWRDHQHPAHAAIADFIGATIRRSALHQLVFYALFTFGIALGMNRLLGVTHSSERWVTLAALGVPFTLIAGAVVGLRTALLLPTNLRAGWMFRMTEDPATRAQQLNAVQSALFTTGVLLPACIAFPIVAAYIGIRDAASLFPITLAIGLAFVEGAGIGWRRVPFTCTFLFGKRPPAYNVFITVLIFGWFVFFGASLLSNARLGVVPWLMIMTMTSAAAGGLRWWRLQGWGDAPLEFQDHIPDVFETIRLGD